MALINQAKRQREVERDRILYGEGGEGDPRYLHSNRATLRQINRHVTKVAEPEPEQGGEDDSQTECLTESEGERERDTHSDGEGESESDYTVAVNMEDIDIAPPAAVPVSDGEGEGEGEREGEREGVDSLPVAAATGAVREGERDDTGVGSTAISPRSGVPPVSGVEMDIEGDAMDMSTLTDEEGAKGTKGSTKGTKVVVGGVEVDEAVSESESESESDANGQAVQEEVVVSIPVPTAAKTPVRSSTRPSAYQSRGSLSSLSLPSKPDIHNPTVYIEPTSMSHYLDDTSDRDSPIAGKGRRKPMADSPMRKGTRSKSTKPTRGARKGGKGATKPREKTWRERETEKQNERKRLSVFERLSSRSVKDEKLSPRSEERERREKERKRTRTGQAGSGAEHRSERLSPRRERERAGSRVRGDVTRSKQLSPRRQRQREMRGEGVTGAHIDDANLSPRERERLRRVLEGKAYDETVHSVDRSPCVSRQGTRDAVVESCGLSDEEEGIESIEGPHVPRIQGIYPDPSLRSAHKATRAHSSTTVNRGARGSRGRKGRSAPQGTILTSLTGKDTGLDLSPSPIGSPSPNQIAMEETDIWAKDYGKVSGDVARAAQLAGDSALPPTAPKAYAKGERGVYADADGTFGRDSVAGGATVYTYVESGQEGSDNPKDRLREDMDT
ncbi:hypothetical protein KIPB_010537, partial [Kipferlia bialata]|eukprot:g10537.t1